MLKKLYAFKNKYCYSLIFDLKENKKLTEKFKNKYCYSLIFPSVQTTYNKLYLKTNTVIL